MPRKSSTSVTAADVPADVSMVSEAPTTSSPKQSKEQKEKSVRKSGGKQDMDVTTIEDLLLPRSIVQRIAKGVLPANTSIQKDAILALTKSATVFISHLADSANEQTDRKTIQSQDVLKALQEIEFDQVMQLGLLGEDGKRGGRLEREIEIWEGNVRGKRAGYREKVKARQSTGTNGDTTLGSMVDGDEDDGLGAEGEGDDEEGRVHENKRLRIDQGDREGSATGEIANSTQKLRLGKTSADQQEDDDVDDDVDEDEESDGQDEDEEEDGLQDDEQDAEDQLLVEDADRNRLKTTLAPDGRVEVDDGSDQDSD